MDAEIKYNLHNHTTYSDGELTPAEMVRYNKQHGYNVIAITDHESMEGVREAIEEGKKQGVLVIPGVEIETQNTHMLGLFLNPKNPALEQFLRERQKQQAESQKSILDALAKRGYTLTQEQLKKFTKSTMLSPYRIAKCLAHYGLVSTTQQAQAIISKIVPPERLKIPRGKDSQAVHLIKNAGGEAIWAHPMSHRRSRMNYLRIPLRAIMLKRKGLSGLEVEHPEQSATEQAFLRALTKIMRLSQSGGADFHDPKDNDMDIWKRRKQREQVKQFLKKRTTNHKLL